MPGQDIPEQDDNQQCGQRKHERCPTKRRVHQMGAEETAAFQCLRRSGISCHSMSPFQGQMGAPTGDPRSITLPYWAAGTALFNGLPPLVMLSQQFTVDGDQGFRQRGVLQRPGILLAVVNGPAEEIYQCGAALRILLLFVEQDVGEPADGIGVFAGGIHDGSADVLLQCFTAPSAAAVVESMLGATNCPALFCMAA